MCVTASLDPVWLNPYPVRFYCPSIYHLWRGVDEDYRFRLSEVWLRPMSGSDVNRARELANQLRESPKIFTYEEYLAKFGPLSDAQAEAIADMLKADRKP